ncbi:Hypothetical protein CCH01_003220 [Clostridium chauvoei JF4335]|nr:Hypothetical protein CCH01_003220 [Clostridium chauvoei JF4335]
MPCNHAIFKNGYALIVFGLDNAPPIPSNKPAAGKIAIGNINDLPIFCKLLNILLLPFIISLVFIFSFGKF